jgi:hypothetical protein
MLGESFFIYKLAQQVGSFLTEPYKEALISERNEDCGINAAKKGLAAAESIDVNTTFAEVHTIEVFFTPEDSLYSIFGKEPVYITPQEMRYISSREDWYDKGTGVLRNIIQRQELRSLLYNASTNVE